MQRTSQLRLLFHLPLEASFCLQSFFLPLITEISCSFAFLRSIFPKSDCSLLADGDRSAFTRQVENLHHACEALLVVVGTHSAHQGLLLASLRVCLQSQEAELTTGVTRADNGHGQVDKGQGRDRARFLCLGIRLRLWRL